MRIAASGGLIHSSSASATGRSGEILQDVPRETGIRTYLLFIGVFAGCFFLAYLMQPWHQQPSSQPQPRQMQPVQPVADQPVSLQQGVSQSNQLGTAYGGMQYAGQPPSYAYFNSGQNEMRVRTNVNR